MTKPMDQNDARQAGLDPVADVVHLPVPQPADTSDTTTSADKTGGGGPTANSDASDASDAFSGPPRFPLDVLPELFQRITRHFAEAVEGLPDLVAPSVLAAVAASLGSAWRVGARAMVRPAILWFALIASSGSTKSPAARPCLKPLHDEDRRLREEFKEAKRAFDEEMRRWQSPNEESPRPLEPKRQRIVLTDITPEGLVSKLDASPRGLLVHSDELVQLIRSHDGYHGTAGRGRAMFLSLWSGTRISEGRKSASESEVDEPFAVIYGGVQPSKLSGLNLEDGDGLAARHLWAYCPFNPGGLGTDLDAEIASLWERCIHLGLRHKVVVVQHLDNEAIEFFDSKLRIWKQTAADLEKAGSGLLASMYGKAGDHCIRLAALLHGMNALAAAVCETADVPALEASIVPRETIERAARLTEYYLAHGAAVAATVVSRPGETELQAKDQELARHLRALVPPGQEVTDTPAGWAKRLSARSFRVSPDWLGRALTRVGAELLVDLRVERLPRGDSRGWRVSHLRNASEASEASGSTEALARSGSDASRPSVGSVGVPMERRSLRTLPREAGAGALEGEDGPADASVASAGAGPVADGLFGPVSAPEQVDASEWYGDHGSGWPGEAAP